MAEQHNQQNEFNGEIESTYPELEKPNVQSTIPQHLLQGTDEQTKYVLHQLSIIVQQNQWLIKSAIDTNQQVRHTNGRVKSVEKWKNELEQHEIIPKMKMISKLSNFWAVAIILAAGMSGIASFVIVILKLLGIVSV